MDIVNWLARVTPPRLDGESIDENEDFSLDAFSMPTAATRSLILMKEMKSSGTTPDDRIYAALVRNLKDPQKVIATHRHVLVNTRTSPFPLFTDFYARQLLQTLHHFRPIITLDTGDALDVNSQQSQSRESLIEKLWDEMRETRTRPSRLTCVAFLEVGGEKGMVENVHRTLILDRGAKEGEGRWERNVVWGLMEAHGRPFLILLLRSFFNRDLHAEVRRAFYAMDQNGIPINDEILSTSIKSLFALRDVEGIHAVHRRLNELFPVDDGEWPVDGLTLRPFIDLVAGYSDMEDVRGCMRGCEDLKVRRMSGRGRLNRGGDVAALVEEARARLVPRKTLADVVRVLALKGLVQIFLNLFNVRCLRLSVLHIIGRESLKVIVLPRKLAGRLGGLERERELGPLVRVGKEGPFGVILRLWMRGGGLGRRGWREMRRGALGERFDGVGGDGGHVEGDGEGAVEKFATKHGVKLRVRGGTD
ncbi:hypothetical protein BC829DRAFT_434788 [Chytridium lagenaria]|nr:hypothetical protein BC829DRAFT_434788 [Chytridium lagenaria]